jgi:hypothetical protein
MGKIHLGAVSVEGLNGGEGQQAHFARLVGLGSLLGLCRRVLCESVTANERIYPATSKISSTESLRATQAWRYPICRF